MYVFSFACACWQKNVHLVFDHARHWVRNSYCTFGCCNPLFPLAEQQGWQNRKCCQKKHRAIDPDAECSSWTSCGQSQRLIGNQRAVRLIQLVFYFCRGYLSCAPQEVSSSGFPLVFSTWNLKKKDKYSPKISCHSLLYRMQVKRKNKPEHSLGDRRKCELKKWRLVAKKKKNYGYFGSGKIQIGVDT